jgi:3-phenylpropionate/cinnamic acid dioxygenase small subunit
MEGPTMSEAHNDRDDIRDVLIRYATGIDSKDWPLFRTCFAADLDADYGELGHWTDLDSLTDYMVASHEHMHATLHRLTNFVITIDGDDAVARHYVHAVLVAAQDPPTWFEALGRYDDTMTKTTDGWQIRQRTFTMARFLSQTSESPSAAAAN